VTEKSFVLFLIPLDRPSKYLPNSLDTVRAILGRTAGKEDLMEETCRSHQHGDFKLFKKAVALLDRYWWIEKSPEQMNNFDFPAKKKGSSLFVPMPRLIQELGAVDCAFRDRTETRNLFKQCKYEFPNRVIFSKEKAKHLREIWGKDMLLLRSILTYYGPLNRPGSSQAAKISVKLPDEGTSDQDRQPEDTVPYLGCHTERAKKAQCSI
jgi:hypothetical protein